MRMAHPRRLVCFMALALLLPVPARAADQPHVVIDDPVHDFGAVEQGEVVEHHFRLRNTGSTPLRVDHVKGTCACTVGVATGEAISPGDSTSVVVRLDTARLAGRTTKAVTVYTDDPAEPTALLTLTGEVLTDLVVTPTPLYLGHVRRGAVVRRALAVVAGRPGATARVQSVETTNPHLRAWIDTSGDDPGQKVEVELDANMPLGRFNGDLVLHTTSDRQRVLTVQILGTIEGDLAVLPPQVTFTLAQGEPAPARDVFIRNRGDRPVAVTRVTVPAEVAYDLTTVEEGVEYQLNLRLRAGLPVGRIEGNVEIFTTHPDESRVVVPLYAIVRPPSRRG
jgi:hypothetical protein